MMYIETPGAPPADNLGWRELCNFQATAELQQAVGAEFSKQLDVFKIQRLFCLLLRLRHESLRVLSLTVLFGAYKQDENIQSRAGLHRLHF